MNQEEIYIKHKDHTWKIYLTRNDVGYNYYTEGRAFLGKWVADYVPTGGTIIYNKNAVKITDISNLISKLYIMIGNYLISNTKRYFSIVETNQILSY